MGTSIEASKGRAPRPREILVVISRTLRTAKARQYNGRPWPLSSASTPSTLGGIVRHVAGHITSAQQSRSCSAVGFRRVPRGGVRQPANAHLQAGQPPCIRSRILPNRHGRGSPIRVDRPACRTVHPSNPTGGLPGTGPAG